MQCMMTDAISVHANIVDTRLTRFYRIKYDFYTSFERFFGIKKVHLIQITKFKSIKPDVT